MTWGECWSYLKAKWGRVFVAMTAGVKPLPPPKVMTPVSPPGPCERCQEREARAGYRLCKNCNDDDDAAMMAAHMGIG